MSLEEYVTEYNDIRKKINRLEKKQEDLFFGKISPLLIKKQQEEKQKKEKEKEEKK